MANGGSSPFREKSLERLSSPERLDQLLRVVDRRSWLPLAALSALVVLLFAWAVFGEVPVHVHGKGILVRPREVVEFQAPGSGYLTKLHVRVGDAVRVGHLLAGISRPDLETQLELQKAKAAELTALGRAADILRLKGAGPAPGSGTLEDHIEASRAVAERIRDKELMFIAQEQKTLDPQLTLARALRDTLHRQLEKQKELHASGVISREKLTEAEEAYIDSLNRVSTLETRLRSLRTRELEVEDEYLGRLQRTADLTFDLQGYEQQIADVNREIARLEAAMDEETRVISEHDGRILEISAVVGNFLAPGDRLGSMAVSDPASTLLSLTYFTVRDGKRLDPEMEIQVTPDTVERERFGGIRGTIDSVSDFPVTLAEVESVVGNREVAETLTAAGYLMQVFATLELDPETASGLAWTSSRGPDMSLSSGTTATARVKIERRPPITFVLPFLKSAMGVD